MAVTSLVAVYFNVMTALSKSTLDDRVSYLIFVVLIDSVILMLYNLLIGNIAMAVFLICKYVIFSFIDFSATLRQNLN